MTVNKEAALYEWAKDNPYLTDRLMFDFLVGQEGSCAIAPVNTQIIKTYIDGSKILAYTFALQVLFLVSESMDTANTDSMFTLRKWQHWIDEQELNRNYPDFGEKCSIIALENTNPMPDRALKFENGFGQYEFFARITYREVK